LFEIAGNDGTDEITNQIQLQVSWRRVPIYIYWSCA